MVYYPDDIQNEVSILASLVADAKSCRFHDYSSKPLWLLKAIKKGETFALLINNYLQHTTINNWKVVGDMQFQDQ